jgi:hypothetical protein
MMMTVETSVSMTMSRGRETVPAAEVEERIAAAAPAPARGVWRVVCSRAE